MIKNTLIALLLCSGFASFGQVVINEMDTDTPSTDDKEFIEFKSAVPNFAMDGYVLVMFNGSTTASNASKSYYAVGLNGLTTDANGILLLGNELVSPVPDKITPVSTMQNGPDAIALYLGTTADFPNNTLATTTNLVDAVAYGITTEQPTPLMNLLGITAFTNENMNALSASQSIQRKPDGTYEVKTPTPGANNDGSGVQYNGVSINVASNLYNEGDNFNITFTTQAAVTSPLSFSVSLTNGTFTSSDYSGNLNITIPTGQISATTNIVLTDDTTDDGDELAKIKFGALPTGYKRLNDNIDIRVIDNDFTTAPWGTPVNPTHGLVAPTIPAGYYDSLEGKTGAVLKQAIQDIIANPAVVHAQNYGDVEFMLKEADQNPLNSNQVWLMYVEQGRAKYKYQSTASNIGAWNREHIYPQSRGGFADGTDSNPNGIDIWLPTNADDINAGHADGHHIRSEDGPENSSRNNRDYGLTDYNGPVGTLGSWHGDVARALFYMACRYNGLSVVNGNPPDSTVGQIGDLATLLTWNVSDPSDDFEMHHNNVIQLWQQNRNPFVDHPDLADHIWGSQVGTPWFSTLQNTQFDSINVGIYPNPATDRLTVSGIENGTIEIYDVSGMKFYTAQIAGQTELRLNLSAGVYLAKVTAQNRLVTKKLLIE